MFDGLDGRKVKYVKGDGENSTTGERAEYYDKNKKLERVEYFKTDASKGDPFKIVYFDDGKKSAADGSSDDD